MSRTTPRMGVWGEQRDSRAGRLGRGARHAHEAAVHAGVGISVAHRVVEARARHGLRVTGNDDPRCAGAVWKLYVDDDARGVCVPVVVDGLHERGQRAWRKVGASGSVTARRRTYSLSLLSHRPWGDQYTGGCRVPKMNCVYTVSSVRGLVSMRGTSSAVGGGALKFPATGVPLTPG